MHNNSNNDTSSLCLLQLMLSESLQLKNISIAEPLQCRQQGQTHIPGGKWEKRKGRKGEGRTKGEVFFGLPLGLAPSTSYSIHFFTQSLSSFHNTCPYHRIKNVKRLSKNRLSFLFSVLVFNFQNSNIIPAICTMHL